MSLVVYQHEKHSSNWGNRSGPLPPATTVVPPASASASSLAPRSDRRKSPDKSSQPDLARLLDLPAYVNDAYATAVAKIQRLDGESGFEWQMRKICYLHLTRFVRVLLDRKDRMSMAVGLEVRVPFCDHRLVEYAYNAPWSLKTYDGQEKSLLRGAIRDLLPDSVLKRVKAPYPSTQDPVYAARLQHIARDQLSQPGHPVFDLVSRDWLSRVTAPGAEVTPDRRRGIERALDLALWLDMYKPTLKTS